MAAQTGIKWTDSTFNSWWGCTKVGPACDHCYAEGVDKRTGENHWGHGAKRRLLSEHARNEPYRWQKQADKFFAEHGRDRRVFTLSMGDLFDNEIPAKWRNDHMGTMEACDRLQWQVCTKRVSNLPKMIFPAWETSWPQNIGVLVTIVTQSEADRDLPRLINYKRRFGIPWVGVSYEPAQEAVDFSRFMSSDPIHVETYKTHGRDRLSGGLERGIADRSRREGLACLGTSSGQVERRNPLDTMRETARGARSGGLLDGARNGEREEIECSSFEVGMAPLQRPNTGRFDDQSQGWSEEEKSSVEFGAGDLFGTAASRAARPESGHAGSDRNEKQHGKTDVESGLGDTQGASVRGADTSGSGSFSDQHSPSVADTSPPPSPDGLDVIIFGGKSGPQWNDRPFSLNWAYRVADDCAALGCSFFFKQVAAFRPTDDMIPADLMIRQWPQPLPPKQLYVRTGQ